jgi:2-oxoglutarate dehydrogenase E2 component (dihydrolipoamide succinyltransferase)
MSVSVSMPQLGESVTEGTVTRWLKKEGERVVADEPLLEVSTDKVDTEIPSPASGILRGIAVDEDETVAVGAQLAVIEEDSDAGASGSGGAPAAETPAAAAAVNGNGASTAPPPGFAQPTEPYQAPTPPYQAQSAQPYAVPSSPPPPPPAPVQPFAARTSPVTPGQKGGTPAPPVAQPYQAPTYPVPPAPPVAPAPAAARPAGSMPVEEYPEPTPLPTGGDTPYVTPLVRKLAAEHAVNLEEVAGTGVGGRIRKQDVIEAARAQRAAAAAAAAAPPAPAEVAPAPAAPSAVPGVVAPASRPAVVPSSLRGTTQKLSRPRQVIAQRMVESLRVSAQLTTVVETDVTAIARLRELAKRDFEAREGVKLSFLPFFALAAVEALKVHSKLNAVLDGDQVTYHDAEHLGIAVDTERGLMVPVIHNAGDLNIGGLARKIGDLAQRTRSGQVSPDELAGGTFTLTNTGSRGALFDTPIINQPQVAILGTGTVVKRPVVVEDPALGEVIAVRSMVYLALTYDHRLVDGADAARYLVTVKNRLEEGSFEAELGL